MKNKRYDKKTNYNGKWILYKECISDRLYTSIYVVSIKDGIVKYYYEHNQDNPMYSDIEEFENYNTFIINPTQMPRPNVKDEADEIINDYNDKISFGRISYRDDKNEIHTCPYGKCSKERCDGYRNGYCTKCVLCSYPPQYQRCHFEITGSEYKFCSEV